MASGVFPKNNVEKTIDVMFDMPHEPNAANKAEVTYFEAKDVYERLALAVSEYYHYVCNDKERRQLDALFTPQMATFFRMRFQLGNGIKPPRFAGYFVAVAGCLDRDRITRCVRLWHTILLPLHDDPNEHVYQGALDCRDEVHQLVQAKLTNIWLNDDNIDPARVEYGIKLSAFAGILHSSGFVSTGTDLKPFDDTLGILLTRIRIQLDLGIIQAFHAWLVEALQGRSIDGDTLSMLRQGFSKLHPEPDENRTADEVKLIKEQILLILGLLQNAA